ncbi:MAG TPA: GTP cyclohydrolase II, partial [Burkholderiales bacterium]|nr:GTP cyclohydrolase II [Burkholderiales bacterium]
RQVRLLTNNPEKVRALEEYGLSVSERVAIEIAPRQSNRKYLQTKRTKFGHLLSLAGQGEKHD